jgi:hypothetical protein
VQSELWALYLVTATGNYLAVVGARPTHERQVLVDLQGLIKKVRPGFGRHYDMHIALLNSEWEPVAADRIEMQRKSDVILDSAG